MLSLQFSLLLSPFMGMASVLKAHPETRDLQPRAAVLGSCISAPDSACVSLVGLCVNQVASGQVNPRALWTSRICTAAATCASMASVLDAVCCAGTCMQPLDAGNLDTATVYAAMVGSCAGQPSSCALTWQPFVDWFYNTIQQTNTNLWPDSGDDVLDRWAEIATWTAFCKGDNCIDSAIPYSNLNDWFHFSSAVTATTPGTPLYAEVFATLEENLDNLTPNMYWPCLFDDPTDCGWDYGPPPPGTFMIETSSDVVVSQQLSPLAAFTPSPFVVGTFPIGRAPNQPANAPSPVYVNGQLLPLVLNGSLVHWNVTTRRSEAPIVSKIRATPLDVVAGERTLNTSSTAGISKRATIVPSICSGPLDIPTTLPTLTYFCPYLPNICENIRSHPDWNSVTDMMELTYDPLDGGRRRKKVCGDAVRAVMVAAGKCDPLQHDPQYWKISCDEFPFSSSLEGGPTNAVVRAVPPVENDLQGTLQSAISQLRTVQNSEKTTWCKPSMCHRYQLKLVDSIPTGADVPLDAVGHLDTGSAFFKSGVQSKYLTNRNVLDGTPIPYETPTDYPPTATRITIPKYRASHDCTPAGQACDDVLFAPSDHSVSLRATRSKRQACVPQPPVPTPTSSAQASSIAAASSSSAKDAAAAAAAAFSSASNPTPEESAIAAAAVAAIMSLGPAADALASLSPLLYRSCLITFSQAMATSDSSLSSAISASQESVAYAQSTVEKIFHLGPNIPDWLKSISTHSSSAQSSVSNAVQSSSNIVKPDAPATPVVDRSKSTIVNSGPPANAAAAACFGAGSKGNVFVGDQILGNADGGNQQAALVDEGSNAFFGLTLGGGPFFIQPVSGCNGVYVLNNGGPHADFQVDCSSRELGAYWGGVKQTCYTYTENPPVINIYCSNNAGNLYSCLQQTGRFGTVNSAFITWAPA
ncbi:hypothetical protein BC628DRAFT_506599 [Trametes gibbosa]|nr:hypothetical protein BC628DRAFT_506599 [Trametes gibbosa]